VTPALSTVKSAVQMGQPLARRASRLIFPRTMSVFADRRQAGRLLSRPLEKYAHEAVTVVALSRGGVPVAYEIATRLGATLVGHDQAGDLDVAGRIVILVDDGVDSGVLMRQAIAALGPGRPRRIVAAVPISAPATCKALGQLVDEMICAVTPDPFVAIGLWYDDFSETTDEEMRRMLGGNTAALGAAKTRAASVRT
jgi:predicted phosphoribosyltransferase